MKSNVKKFFFLFSVLILVAISLYFKYPVRIMTSLTDLLPETADGFPKKTVLKYSSVVNFIVEAPVFAKAKKTSDLLYERLTEDGYTDITYKNEGMSINAFLDFFAGHKNSFLSNKSRALLKTGRYAEITDNAIAKIASSWIPLTVPVSSDPFALVSDYVEQIEKPSVNWQQRDGVMYQKYNDACFVLMVIGIPDHDTEKMTEKVKELKKLARIFSIDNVTVHVSGVPVHTAYMYAMSKKEITFFSILSAIFAVILTIILFSDIKAVFTVAENLIFGFLCGCAAVIICFSDIYMLTFVFGASLIGICIDYSFHRLAVNQFTDKKLTDKNILHSFLTTVLCFLPLLFSSLPLLKQIAVFMIGGLCGTYIWVCILSNPLYTVKKKFKIPVFSGFIRIGILFLFCVAILIGVFFIKVDNSLKDFYRPNKELATEESLFLKLNGKGFSRFLIVEGNSLQKVLEIEEMIREKHNFFGISTLLPSLKRQKENAILIKDLYQTEKTIIHKKLGLKNIPKFTEEKPFTEKEFSMHFGFLFDRFVIQDRGKIWSVSPVSDDFPISLTNAKVFSPQSNLKSQLDQYGGESMQFLPVCFIVLSVMLFLLYGKKVFSYLLPSFLGVAGTLGFLSLVGQTITFFHLLSFFIIVGLSIDYTIFHLSGDSEKYLCPVFFSFLTSFIGFGLLAFAEFFLISAMGTTISIGLLLTYFLSLIVFRKEDKIFKGDMG